MRDLSLLEALITTCAFSRKLLLDRLQLNIIKSRQNTFGEYTEMFLLFDITTVVQVTLERVPRRSRSVGRVNDHHMTNVSGTNIRAKYKIHCASLLFARGGGASFGSDGVVIAFQPTDD